VFFDELKRVAHWVGPIGLLGVLLVSPGNPARPLLLGAGVLYLGVFFHYLGNFGRHGDFSYGTYIWHFPLIQTFIALGLLQAYPYASTAALIVLVLGMAVISWKFVERPFLLKKSHYVVAETEPEVGSGEGEEGSAVGTLHVDGLPPGKQLGSGTK
jgi:peptidoglycan/LPS O-acetylase OafA/YrhL